MPYRWKKTLEAVQLPGDLPPSSSEGPGLNAEKGNWLIFENGVYIGVFDDKEFRDRVEDSIAPHKKRSNSSGKPKLRRLHSSQQIGVA